jgi:hypothetical protein
MTRARFHRTVGALWVALTVVLVIVAAHVL